MLDEYKAVTQESLVFGYLCVLRGCLSDSTLCVNWLMQQLVELELNSLS